MLEIDLFRDVAHENTSPIGAIGQWDRFVVETVLFRSRYLRFKLVGGVESADSPPRFSVFGESGDDEDIVSDNVEQVSGDCLNFVSAFGIMNA